MEKAKNSLLAKKENSVATAKKPRTVVDLVQSMQKQFEIALPKHINSERFVRIAITSIRQNPKLAKCSQESLLGALMTSAQLGLEPGILGQAYLIPYKDNVQFQIGYKGMIELLRRSGQLSDIYACEIRENDDFQITLGLHRDIKHNINFNEDRGEVVGYYAVAVLKDGANSFEFMTKKQVEEHRDKFSKTSTNTSPWKTDFDEMAKKTVIKKLLKYLPVSVEWLENVSKDEKVLTVATPSQNANMDELEPIELNLDEVTEDNSDNIQTLDWSTGEVIEDRKEVEKSE